MSTLERWIGGSPLGVVIRLLFLSLVVGILLAAFGLTPVGIVRQIVDGFRAVMGLGIDAFREFGSYILTGAMIVIPLWLLSRVLGARRGG